MQMISEHAGMLELFDRQRNHTDPAQISMKTDNKYWFTIEGHSLFVSPRTVLCHFELDTPWNFGRLGQTHAYDDYGDVIVHVFSKEDRLFYDLERIWRDGKIVESVDEL